MPEPTQTCALCGRSVTVVQTGRGFPPDIAKRTLARRCKAAGCSSEPVYRAGISPELEAMIRPTAEPVCRYCGTPSANPCCGAAPCRSQHGARLLGQLHAVIEDWRGQGGRFEGGEAPRG